MDLSVFLKNELLQNGFDTAGSDSHIVPVVLGSNETALAFAANLQARGYGVRAIRPPTVPDGTARLRMSLTAKHTQPMLADLVGALVQIRKEIAPGFGDAPFLDECGSMNGAKNGFFVTGTDTGVGKTVLSALLVAALDAVYWKPVQTGVVEGTDSESVRMWAEIPEERLLPERYCFDPPVSPHLAARDAGVRIDLDSFEFPDAPAGRTWIVEGAGGVMVPLNERDLMVDLMRHLGLPVVIAARTALGTINHTLLTLAALRSADLDIRGVVLIGAENTENRRAIEHYGDIPVIGHIPVLERIDRAALLDVFSKNFDRAAFQEPGRLQATPHPTHERAQHASLAPLYARRCGSAATSGSPWGRCVP